MLFAVVVLNLRYRLKYVKFWFREWYGKDKGDAMSSRVWDALKRLCMERMGQNGASSSSGSGSRASLSRDSEPSVGNLHCLIALKVIIIGLSNTWRIRIVWNANQSWIGICWNLVRTMMWKILTF